MILFFWCQEPFRLIKSLSKNAGEAVFVEYEPLTLSCSHKQGTCIGYMHIVDMFVKPNVTDWREDL